jgi:phage terminase large subunit
MQAQLPDWASVLFDASPRYFAIHGGRGSAKSRSVATALLLRAAEKPLRVLCAREIQKSIRDSVKRLLDDEITRLGLGGFYTSLETEIRGANGSLFIFAGLRSNVDSVKSMEGIDVCWVEEAQTVSQGSLDTLIPTIRAPGSQIIFTWNPKAASDPVDAMFRGETAPPGTVCREVNWQDNPWFPSVLAQEKDYDQKRDPGRYAHVWEGAYLTMTEARVFKHWRVEEFTNPPDVERRLGADWGFSVDPTVLVSCYVVGRTLYVDHEAWQIGCQIEDTPALFLTVPDAEKWPIVADSSRPETIAHMRKHGFPKIMPAVKGPRSVEEGIEWLQSHDIVVHPRCRHVIDELATYSFKTDPLTGAVLPILEDKHNHTVDALRYACESARRLPKKAPPPVKLVSVAHHWSR